MIGPFRAALAGAALLAGFVAFVIALVLVGLMLFIAGRIVVGRKATFGAAVAIAFLGSLAGFILSLFLPRLGPLMALVVWLCLIKSFFSTDWIQALAVGLLAVLVTVAVRIVVGILFRITLFALP